jgi:Transcription initiation factor IID, 18kD subunit
MLDYINSFESHHGCKNSKDKVIVVYVACLSKPVRCMMYGFGDDQNPYSESVDMLEDLVVEFITEMVIYLCVCLSFV